MNLKESSCKDNDSALQDSPGGSFDSLQAFSGRVTEVQLWEGVLEASDIKAMAQCQTLEPQVGEYPGCLIT